MVLIEDTYKYKSLTRKVRGSQMVQLPDYKLKQCLNYILSTKGMKKPFQTTLTEFNF